MTDTTISKKEITTIVAQLFDGDIKNIPSKFSIINPLTFGKELIKQKNKLGYNSKINIPMNYHIEQAEMVLKKINEARLVLTGAQFEIILSIIETNADISVWGSNDWMPRLLPNGAVLIRNHHRVIALSERISGILNINNEQLHTYLSDFYNNNKNHLDNDTSSFNFIHRTEDGVSWTNKLPDELSDFGQTLIFISKSIIELVEQNYFVSSSNILFDPLILKVAEESRSGHCILRVFKNKTFLYSTYRAGDEYDTIIENFSYYLGEKPDEDICEQSFSTKSEFVNNYIKSTLKENDEVEIFTTKTLKNNKILRLLLEDKFYNDFSNRKTWQVLSFEPFFAREWNKPTTYYEEYIPFWDISEYYNGNLIAVTSNLAGLSNVIYGESEFKQKVKKALYCVPNSFIKLHLPLSNLSNQLNYIDENDVFEYGTKECNNRIKDFFNMINNQYQKDFHANQSGEYSEKDFFEYNGDKLKFSLLFITKNNPEPVDFHQYGIDISTHLSNVTIIVPSYGFNQGYSEGEIDTGNSSQFII